jgi:3-oxoacyl-[acyl-carrier protein] reductase
MLAEMEPQHAALQGRTAVVTGSARNIGRAIAVALAAEGANVVVNGHRDAVAVESVVEEISNLGGKAVGVMADVSVPEEVERLVRESSAAFGGVDIAVSNVGVRRRQAFEEITIDDWHATLAVNLHACFYMAHFTLPAMRERGWGRIIHISGSTSEPTTSRPRLACTA